MKLWAGQTVSELGSVVTRTAVPLVALLVLAAGPFEMALLVVSASFGVLLVGLFAGVLMQIQHLGNGLAGHIGEAASAVRLAEPRIFREFLFGNAEINEAGSGSVNRHEAAFYVVLTY